MRSKVIYRMSSNWQSPALFFNAIGMNYILIPNKGAREKACLDVLGQGHRIKSLSFPKRMLRKHNKVGTRREIGSQKPYSL